MFENPINKVIKRELGVISTSGNKGWQLKARVISWNGNADKLDIRAWSPDDSRCGKGLSFTTEEARSLYRILKGMFDSQSTPTYGG